MNENIDCRPINFEYSRNIFHYEFAMITAMNIYQTFEEKQCYYIQKKLTFYHNCLTFCEQHRFRLHAHMRRFTFLHEFFGYVRTVSLRIENEYLKRNFYMKLNEIAELLRINNLLMEQVLKKYKDRLRELFEFEFTYPDLVALHEEYYAEVNIK